MKLLSIPLVLLSTLGIPFLSVGQFEALPMANATWLVDVHDGPNLVAVHQYHLPASGHDTIIGGETFYTLNHPDPLSIGAVRDNQQGQVYFHEFLTDETKLLYNFDVVVGAIVPEVYNTPFNASPMYVITVDTVIHAGKARKRIGINPVLGSSIPSYHWIQGIGGTGGLVSTCCQTISNTYTLNCMSENDTIQYGAGEGGVGVCFVPQSVTVPNPVAPVNVVPNPSNDVFILNVSPDGSTLVYNAQGQLELKSSGREISLTNSPRGAYVAIIFFNGRQYHIPLVKVD